MKNKKENLPVSWDTRLKKLKLSFTFYGFPSWQKNKVMRVGVHIGKDNPTDAGLGLTYYGGKMTTPCFVYNDSGGNVYIPRWSMDLDTIMHEATHVAHWAVRRAPHTVAELSEIVPDHSPARRMGTRMLAEEARAVIAGNFMMQVNKEMIMRGLSLDLLSTDHLKHYHGEPQPEPQGDDDE